MDLALLFVAGGVTAAFFALGIYAGGCLANRELRRNDFAANAHQKDYERTAA